MELIHNLEPIKVSDLEMQEFKMQHGDKCGIWAGKGDCATLWALVCTAEALNASGIMDPYKLYKLMHPSKVGTCIRSGMGGVTSMA